MVNLKDFISPCSFIPGEKGRTLSLNSFTDSSSPLKIRRSFIMGDSPVGSAGSLPSSVKV